MAQGNQGIDFTVNQDNLYREENITDMKVASIRRLVPIKPDGSRDDSRTEQYVGSTQLMSPEGPLPLQAMLEANSFEEALHVFPAAMEKAMAQMIEQFQKMQEMQKKQQQQSDSRIIVPGR
ncbi:MAG: cytoplasmic protein [Desulfobacterales bacterium]|jgi:hypothetical protein|nr:cytoplasmic protein [Desulfobacterales bacterium]